MITRFTITHSGGKTYATDDDGRRSRPFDSDPECYGAIQRLTGWWSISITQADGEEFVGERMHPRVDPRLARAASEVVRREIEEDRP